MFNGDSALSLRPHDAQHDIQIHGDVPISVLDALESFENGQTLVANCDGKL